MKRSDPIRIPYASMGGTGAWPENVPFPVPLDDKGEYRFEIETWGMHRAIRKLVGLAVEKAADGLIVYGRRSLDKPHESGYNMEGRVRVGGKTLRAFTSSQLFMIGGKLVDVAILYVCRPDADKPAPVRVASATSLINAASELYAMVKLADGCIPGYRVDKTMPIEKVYGPDLRINALGSGLNSLSMSVGREAIILYEDNGGPSYARFVGTDAEWAEGKDFFDALSGLNAKLYGEPRRYIHWHSSDEPNRTLRYGHIVPTRGFRNRGEAIYLRPGRDSLGREWQPEAERGDPMLLVVAKVQGKLLTEIERHLAHCRAMLYPNAA